MNISINSPGNNSTLQNILLPSLYLLTYPFSVVTKGEEELLCLSAESGEWDLKSLFRFFTSIAHEKSYVLQKEAAH